MAAKLELSHLELSVDDLAAMERFYASVLGFHVTDRSETMVFLSLDEGEHHQLVLCAAGRRPGAGALDHIAFRSGDLGALRSYFDRLSGGAAQDLQAVSHGNTWSLYFRDPEGNRVEIFTETPWHVDQPVRFPIDFSLDDTALAAATEARIRDLPGFRPLSEWLRIHKRYLTEASGSGRP